MFAEFASPLHVVSSHVHCVSHEAIPSCLKTDKTAAGHNLLAVFVQWLCASLSNTVVLM